VPADLRQARRRVLATRGSAALGSSWALPLTPITSTRLAPRCSAGLIGAITDCP